MPFVKNDARINRTGRPKEATNSRLREAIRGKVDVDQLWNEIQSLEPKDRVNAKLKLLEYAIPRLSTVHTSELSIEEQISNLTKGELSDLIDTILEQYGEQD